MISRLGYLGLGYLFLMRFSGKLCGSESDYVWWVMADSRVSVRPSRGYGFEQGRLITLATNGYSPEPTIERTEIA